MHAGNEYPGVLVETKTRVGYTNIPVPTTAINLETQEIIQVILMDFPVIFSHFLVISKHLSPIIHGFLSLFPSLAIVPRRR